MLKNVTHAKCVRCGAEYEAVPGLTTCTCGGIMDIVYDYDYIKAHFTRDDLERSQEWSMWRYRHFLPVEADSAPTPLRVGWSPLYRADNLARALGLKPLLKGDPNGRIVLCGKARGRARP